MNPSCLDYLLTEDERERFDREGYFVVPNALAPDRFASLRELADEIDQSERQRLDCDRFERMNHYDVIGRDPRLLELLDWPQVFAKVWGILGWNIQLYHTHLTVNPSAPGAVLRLFLPLAASTRRHASATLSCAMWCSSAPVAG